MKRSIIALDPGESTGWVFVDTHDRLTGGTAPKNHLEVVKLLEMCSPDIVVIERFNLYPGMAKSLAWNSFYPCEVIGVVKCYCMQHGIAIVEQAPSVKKYAGGLKDDWAQLKHTVRTTEHTKDAYQHLKYYLRNGGKKYI